MKPVLMDTDDFLAATVARCFRFIAENSSGATIKEAAISAFTHAQAYRSFFDGMTDAQRDACACVECLDVVSS